MKQEGLWRVGENKMVEFGQTLTEIGWTLTKFVTIPIVLLFVSVCLIKRNRKKHE